MNLRFIKETLIVLMLSTATANAGLIDFTSVDSFTNSPNRIDRIGDVTFSHDLYSHPDGFYLQNGFAWSYYGENGMYFTFDDAVEFTSLDIGPYCCNTPDTFKISAFDFNNNLLNSITFNWTNTWATYTLNQGNVSKVSLEFTGGTNVYNDGRLHAWYAIDNIRYKSIDVPEPSTLAIFALGMIGLASRRFKKQP